MIPYEKQDRPKNERLACPWSVEPPVLALVVKRTYDLKADGSCRLADEQCPIYDDVVLHDEVEPPRVASPKWDNDLFVQKPMTDVIVQGSAYPHQRAATETLVELRFADTIRTVKVFGKRRIEWQKNGQSRFTPPEPFEGMPLTYEHAYGGQDQTALKKYTDPVAEVFDFFRPEWQLATTSPFHYPRNPAGRGYVIEDNQAHMDGLEVPNLEWPEDPLTPSRMVVGAVKDWLKGPLPAGFDWYEQAWFPRSAYIGLIAEHNLPEEGVPEVNQKRVSPDLMEPRDLVDKQLHPNFVLGASPGLSTDKVKPGMKFLLINMSLVKREYVIELPAEVPSVLVDLPRRKQVQLKPFLNTVAICPDGQQLVVVWSCRAEVERPYGSPEFDYIPYKLKWK